MACRLADCVALLCSWACGHTNPTQTTGRAQIRRENFRVLRSFVPTDRKLTPLNPEFELSVLKSVTPLTCGPTFFENGTFSVLRPLFKKEEKP